MTFARILVAVDETPQSDAALALAVQLAGDQHADLTITTVLRNPGEWYAPPDVIVDPAIDARLEEDARALLDRAAQSARERGIATVDTCLREGPVIDAIVSCIADHHADLIVLGTHARRGIARAVQGSVAEGVLRATAIPVLIAHAVS
ncbi:MAG TPA: universal stress protein [Candidatus Elarobacter sp.]|jgi:nucleotide-binding universal stress UspA family protein|nr:universal stress protein [Candidatus Elarobacter sp.]